ncbi:MAG TPA: dienelactone hydrolase family protein, partial [Bryobacteraceae bacterium]|nr:dienelactone hydrolase family protein [Bryobacteraceae bacterium]
KSPRNRLVAARLQSAGYATLLFDLLTPDEERIDARTAHLRFDIPLLARRLSDATVWACQRPLTRDLPFGYFGASTGAAAALVAAAENPEQVRGIVSRGGRPDLAGESLEKVTVPTLLIVGGADTEVIDLNERALQRMHAKVRLEIVEGATHLFEEPGALEDVSTLAIEWFDRYLR